MGITFCVVCIMCPPFLFRVGRLGGPGRLARLVLCRGVLGLLLAEVRITCVWVVCMCFSLLS